MVKCTCGTDPFGNHDPNCPMINRLAPPLTNVPEPGGLPVIPKKIRMTCEVHKDCPDAAVAQVGLPSFKALWVCQRGFNEFIKKTGFTAKN